MRENRGAGSMEGSIVKRAGRRARGSEDDRCRGEDGVRGRRQCVEVGGCGEAVDEGRFAAEVWFIDSSGASSLGGSGGRV